MRTVATFTRAQIQAALDAADVGVLGEAFYACRTPFRGTCLAIDFDTLSDFAVFAAVVGELLPTAEDRRDFADAVRSNGESHFAHWPGYILDEPTRVSAQDRLAAAQ